jgi:hypothetical protein
MIISYDIDLFQRTRCLDSTLLSVGLAPALDRLHTGMNPQNPHVVGDLIRECDASREVEWANQESNLSLDKMTVPGQASYFSPLNTPLGVR